MTPVLDHQPEFEHGLKADSKMVTADRSQMANAPFDFLGLPAECRNLIMRYQFEPSSTFPVVDGLPRLEGFDLHAVTRVNKQLREETLKLFMTESQWIVPLRPSFKDGVQRPRKPEQQALAAATFFRNVVFHVESLPIRFDCADGVIETFADQVRCMICVHVQPDKTPRVRLEHSEEHYEPSAPWEKTPLSMLSLWYPIRTMCSNAQKYIERLVARENFKGLSLADLDDIANQFVVDVAICGPGKDLGLDVLSTSEW